MERLKGLVVHVRGGVNMARLLLRGQGSGADYVLCSILVGIGYALGSVL